MGTATFCRERKPAAAEPPGRWHGSPAADSASGNNRITAERPALGRGQGWEAAANCLRFLSPTELWASSAHHGTDGVYRESKLSSD